MPENLLIVDDDLDMTLLLDRFFSEHGFQTFRTTSGQEALKICRETTLSVALCDFRLPDIEGLDLLKQIRQLQPQAAVIIITGYSDVRVAVRAIKFGAFDYVTKPLIPDQILEKVKAAMEKKRVGPPKPAGSSKPNAPSNPPTKAYLRGADANSEQLHRFVELVGPTEMTVLIRGETGSGKERVARLVHEHSNRSDGPFMALDCGALTENLAGSELFGHKKGAFTGAMTDKEGYFESAAGGTLFLDEIGNLNYEIQVQLLRVLQERKVRRLGETKTRVVDVRLVAATNEDLKMAVEAGSFREDLYHRLNEFELVVPPLRERKDDLIRFAEFFLIRSNSELGTTVSGFSSQVQQIFLHYDWPGNLREMQNVVKRGTLLAQEGNIEEAHLPQDLSLARVTSDEVEDEDALKAAALEAEKQVILNALERAKFNKSQAARDLNIDRKTLYNKIKILGIKT